MPTILLTNDDGLGDGGLLALKECISKIPDAEILVVAPENNRSAFSHAITMHDGLRLKPGRMADGSRGYACSGTPADCVRLALSGVVDGIVPDLVISGINSGHNMGIDIHYSGTAACAREAAINGVPAIATSTVFRTAVDDIEAVYVPVAETARRYAEHILANGLAPNLFLNINSPGLTSSEVKGVRATSVGERRYSLGADRRDDPFGYPYYWAYGGRGPVDVHDIDTDVGAVAEGYISVTPITLDPTDHGFLPELKSWQIG